MARFTSCLILVLYLALATAEETETTSTSTTPEGAEEMENTSTSTTTEEYNETTTSEATTATSTSTTNATEAATTSTTGARTTSTTGAPTGNEAQGITTMAVSYQQAELRMSDVSKFEVGMEITISGGGNTDEKFITAITPDSTPDSSNSSGQASPVSGTIQVDGPIQFDFPVGAIVMEKVYPSRDLNLTLRANITAGDYNVQLEDIRGIVVGDLFTISSMGNTETRTVTRTQPTRRLAEERNLAGMVRGFITVNDAFDHDHDMSAATVTITHGPGTGSMGSDPVVWYNGESKEFWLPVGKLTPIIHTRHLNMFASTFVGSPREQWMDRIVVTNADGFRFADIRIKKNIAHFNRSKSPPNAFESIDLTLGMGHSPLKEMPDMGRNGEHLLRKRMDVRVSVSPLNKVFNWLPWHVDQTHIGKANREAVVITSPDVRFLIISSPATEYAGDFHYLSVQYAHLDIHVLDMEHKQSVRGLLPELWGIQKMSNRTMELCTPPWSSKGASIEHQSVDVDAQWNQAFQV